MHRRVPSARRSATRSGFRGLARRLVFPQIRPAALMGFNALRSVAPAAGGRASLRRRAHLPFALAHAPIDFRRVDRLRPVGITMEPEKDVRDPRAASVRLLGFTPVCGPRPWLSLSAGRDPALGFASCRVVDTRSCIRAGSTPPRIISLRPGVSSTPRLSAPGLWRSFRTKITFQRLPPSRAPCPLHAPLLYRSAVKRRRPFSVLWG